MYNNHPRDQKIVVFVDRWLLEQVLLCRKNSQWHIVGWKKCMKNAYI